MTNGTDIAAEVEAAIAEAGAATGDGAHKVILEQKGAKSGPDEDPTFGAPTYTELTVIERTRMAFDAQNDMAAKLRRTLMVGATSVEPTKADRVNIGGTLSGQKVTGGVWHEIQEVATERTGGTALFHKLELMT